MAYSTWHLCFPCFPEHLCRCYKLSVHCFHLLQMCEQAAEAHKSKGSFHSSRRSRTTSDPSQLTKSSVDAILAKSSSVATSSPVCICLHLVFFLYFNSVRFQISLCIWWNFNYLILSAALERCLYIYITVCCKTRRPRFETKNIPYIFLSW